MATAPAPHSSLQGELSLLEQKLCLRLEALRTNASL
jgi:hypothetical protein